jgi:NADH-quinone oxidoreductase subunit J
VMMLFLFVLMLVGVSSADSLVETIKGQRKLAVLAGVAFAVLVMVALGHARLGTFVGAGPANAGGGNVKNLADLIFSKYFWAFEVTSALLITAAVGAMVLAFAERTKQGRLTQRERVEARIRSARPSPLPGPGVFATINSVATPALLPDGSVAPESLSQLLESTSRNRLDDDLRSVAGAGADPGRRALRGPETPSVPDQEGER